MSSSVKTPAELEALRAKARLRVALHREVGALLEEPLTRYDSADALIEAAMRYGDDNTSPRFTTPNVEAYPVLTAFLQAQAQGATQMTLGSMIAALERMPAAASCDLHHPHSYRGYYDDLALDMRGIPRSVGEVLADARETLGTTFSGYKGGGYRMDADTLVWVADYGNCGYRLVLLSLMGGCVVVGTASDNT